MCAQFVTTGLRALAAGKALGLAVELIKEILRLIMGFFDWGETTVGGVVDEILKIIDKLFGREEAQ